MVNNNNTAKFDIYSTFILGEVGKTLVGMATGEGPYQIIYINNMLSKLANRKKHVDIHVHCMYKYIV